LRRAIRLFPMRFEDSLKNGNLILKIVIRYRKIRGFGFVLRLRKVIRFSRRDLRDFAGK
jgi:hypothetical protein